MAVWSGFSTNWGPLMHYKPYYYLGADPTPGRTASSYRDHRGPVLSPSGPVVRDHRDSTRIPPVVTQPPVVTTPVTPPISHPRRRPEEPPHAHHTHNDYTFVPGYDWWPRWYPYWDPYWYWYWQYLYWHYQGYAHPEYAEQARDEYLRSIAPQWGWY